MTEEPPDAFTFSPIAEDEDARISSCAPGTIVPTPILPALARNKLEVAVMVLVPEKYGNCPVVPE